MNALNANLVTLAQGYARWRGVSLWRVGHLAANRGSFFVDLREDRRHCQTDTYSRVLQWFSDRWPSELAWPASAQRRAAREAIGRRCMIRRSDGNPCPEADGSACAMTESVARLLCPSWAGDVVWRLVGEGLDVKEPTMRAIAAVLLMIVAPVVAIGDEGAPPLIVPVGGTDAVDWVINNYVDLDPAADRLRDNRGGRKTYDGHRGVDFDAPNFRWMDENRLPVRAAAAGTVIRVHDGEPDRNTSCRGTANVVHIQHANGHRTRYVHLKRGSIAVEVGQEVEAGERLGIVGSSGCSTAPHLHFEVLDAHGARLDPFRDELGVKAPRYNVPLTILDYYVQEGRIRDAGKDDPGPNIAEIPRGRRWFGMGISVAGEHARDSIRVIIRNGNTRRRGGTVTFDASHRHTYWYWNFEVDKSSGTWRVGVYVNGDERVSHEMAVR